MSHLEIIGLLIEVKINMLKERIFIFNQYIEIACFLGKYGLFKTLKK